MQHMEQAMYRIRKNIGVELNLANWRFKIKSPIFYLAKLFCTRLTQNLACDPSVVAVIQSLKNTWRPCLQLLIHSDDGNAEKRQTISAPKQRTVDFVSAKHRRSTEAG